MEKIVNKKYKIEVFKSIKTGNFYCSDANNIDYYNTNTTVSGIYILDIINNYSDLIPFEVYYNGKKLLNIPKDLFIYKN